MINWSKQFSYAKLLRTHIPSWLVDEFNAFSGYRQGWWWFHPGKRDRPATDEKLYYFAGAVRVGMRDDNGDLYWLLGDHLGSTRVVLVEGEYSNC